ncbi:MAG: hypothetical protein RL220_1800 [Bacteroidota bacterium]|jgi:D-alanyl-D-alanine carboxypeptidase
MGINMAVAQVDPALAAALQGILDNQVNNVGHHGVSACVIMPDGEIWTGQSGVDEAGNNVAEETLFIAASTTKTHLATLYLLLQEEGLIDLDDSWTEHVTLPISVNPSITIRQLLSHTSGIDDYLESQVNADLWLDPEHAYTPDEILTDFVPELALFSPGTDFQYSNSNYLILGKMAEAITGNSLAAELRSRIWEPLQLEHTYLGGFETTVDPFAGIWWNFGQGVTPYNDISHNAMYTYAFGAGNILTTPHDEATFLRALVGGELISPESWQEMTAFVPWSNASWTSGYGLGIHHADGDAGDEILGHDGYYLNLTSMFHSELYGFTAVTMTNTQQGWFGIFNPVYDELSSFLNIDDSQDSTPEVLVYPNPSAGQVTIRSADTAGITHLEILDSTGRTAFRSQPNMNNPDLALSLEPGMYLVRTGTGISIPLIVQ